MSKIASGRNYEEEFNETVYFSSRLHAPYICFFYFCQNVDHSSPSHGKRSGMEL